MVNEAKQNLDDTLTNAPTGTIEGERLPDEHVTLMRSTCSIAEEQFPIAEKCEIQVKAAQSSSSLQLPADISSQSHTSDLTPKLEHDAWPSQKPSEVKSRFACSATDALDRRSLLHIASLSNRPVLPESWFPSTPEENALNFTISQQGSTTSTTSDRVPDIPSSTEPHNITDSAKGRERDRILTLEQQWSAIYRARDRRRTTSYTYIEAKASAPAFERLDEDYPSMQPHLSLSVAPNLRSVIPTTRYSRSSSSLNSAVPIGYSYSSDSLSSTVPMGYSHFPSSSQLPPPSASRPIASKKLFSLDDDDFRSSPSPKDWDIPLRLRHETEFVHSPQTPDEHPQSWQSPNFRTRHSSQDTCYRYYHAQHVHPYEDDLDGSDLWVYDERRLRQREESFQKREEEISMREQELKRREEDIIREEAAKEKGDKFMRGEKEVKRMEDEVVCKELEIARQEEGEIIEYQEDKIKWKEKLVKEKEEKAGRPEAQDWKRAEDLRRREEPVARRLEEEERRMTRNVLQKSEESKCQEDEVKSKERASGTKEAEIQRKEEELVRREEELFQREAEMNRRHDQQKVQQEEFRKHVEEIKRQSVEEKTRQGRKSWGYHPRRTTPPPRMSTSRSFSSSVGPWSISDRDKRMPAASPPANRDRGRSTSISTSRSSTTWTSSTRLSSTNSWRSNMSKPQTPLAQVKKPHQMSPPDSNELHMSAGSPTADRGRTCTTRSNATWRSSSRPSSKASLHLSSTPNPQTPSAYRNPPRQMSTSKSSSSSTRPRSIPNRDELHMSTINSHRDRSRSTSTSRSKTPWMFGLNSITQSSTPKLPISSSQKSLPPRASSQSTLFSKPTPKRNDLDISAISSPTHKSRSKSTSTGRSGSTWMYSTRPLLTANSQPSKSQTPSAQNMKVAPCAMEVGVMKVEEDSKGDRVNGKGILARKEVGEETQRKNTVRPEEERRITHDLSPRPAESEQPVREKECNTPISHNSRNMLPQAQSLLNTSASSSSETAATDEEANSDSLEDLTNELQGRSRYPIAFGGFGDIWKCDLVKSSGTVQVAVKTIRSFESDNEELMRKNVKRVRRELKVWGRLKHHSILPLYGVANDFGPHPAMICPWADNGALTGFLERQQDVLSSQDKFSLLNDIALGLQYLHNESVIHGDLTGSNVLIYGNGRACLADFGLSTIILEFIGTSYFTSSIRGNVRWVAAELCEASEDDEISLSTECDIYSFGSITLQVLTCKVPYYNVKNDILVLAQVIKGKKPEPPKESQIATEHWQFIQRCWLSRASRPSVGEIVAFVDCERQALLQSHRDLVLPLDGLC